MRNRILHHSSRLSGLRRCRSTHACDMMMTHATKISHRNSTHSRAGTWTIFHHRCRTSALPVRCHQTVTESPHEDGIVIGDRGGCVRPRGASKHGCICAAWSWRTRHSRRRQSRNGRAQGRRWPAHGSRRWSPHGWSHRLRPADWWLRSPLWQPLCLSRESRLAWGPTVHRSGYRARLCRTVCLCELLSGSSRPDPVGPAVSPRVGLLTFAPSVPCEARRPSRRRAFVMTRLLHGGGGGLWCAV